MIRYARWVLFIAIIADLPVDIVAWKKYELPTLVIFIVLISPEAQGFIFDAVPLDAEKVSILIFFVLLK